MKIEKVSVAICTYCGERFLSEQLNSIINQSRPVQEIVLCDDNSSDRTVAVADAILSTAGIPCQIFRNDSTLGVTKNFERCISLCSGDIILTADQDDIWAFEKVETLTKLFSDPQVVLAYSDAKIIDEKGTVIDPSLYQRDGFWLSPFTQKRFQDAIIRLSQTVYGCTMAFRSSFVHQIIPFFESKANHDAWIMCCAPLFGRVAFSQDALISYRIHGKNTVASLCGSEVWNQIVSQQDDFERYFAIQPLRELRLKVLERAISISEESSVFQSNVLAACRFYSRLKKIKESKRRITAAWSMLCSAVDGSYRFRFCDRNRTVSFSLKAKQFVRDILYLLQKKESV